MPPRILLLTALAMLAFAGNSLLCRLALRETDIDAASFTAIRLLSGAFTLWLLLRLRQNRQAVAGNWPGALALFVYAATFSFAYLQLDTGAGALLLFGAVQLSMLLWGCCAENAWACRPASALRWPASACWPCCCQVPAHHRCWQHWRCCWPALPGVPTRYSDAARATRWR